MTKCTGPLNDDAFDQCIFMSIIEGNYVAERRVKKKPLFFAKYRSFFRFWSTVLTEDLDLVFCCLSDSTSLARGHSGFPACTIWPIEGGSWLTSES